MTFMKYMLLIAQDGVILVICIVNIVVTSI